jgi:hypothetical protein
MNDPISMTPQEIGLLILGVCGAIITIGNAWVVISNWVKAFKQPEATQNERINKIEQDIKAIQHCLSIDKKRLDNIEYGNTVTQEALLALLNNAINKEDIEGIKKAKQRLEKYLLDRERLPHSYESNIED